MDAIITELARVDALFDRYADRFGKQQTPYRNHVYRLVNLICAQRELDQEDFEKVQIAGFFHDAGIWLAGTFDYLEPSARLACHYLEENQLGAWREDVAAMIFNHHKLSRFSNEATNLVECFRRADWIDVSLGLLRFGVARSQVRAIQQRFPNAGFHRLLLAKGSKHLLSHPFRPLPMLRR